MRPAAALAVTVLLMVIHLCLPLHAAAGKYTAKLANTPPPDNLAAEVRSLMETQSMQVLNEKGELYCEVWFRKAVPAKATPEQVKNGLTYREVPETTIVGAIRYAQQGHDYREQKVRPGVYTIRLAFQPQDGDHMGTAPHAEFVLLVDAARDTKPATVDGKTLHIMSSTSLGGNHPGVLLLFPNDKPEAETKLVDQGMGHWVIKKKLQIDVAGKPATLGISLTVVGHAIA
jgi:hypothetical protein